MRRRKKRCNQDPKEEHTGRAPHGTQYSSRKSPLSACLYAFGKPGCHHRQGPYIELGRRLWAAPRLDLYSGIGVSGADHKTILLVAGPTFQNESLVEEMVQ